MLPARCSMGANGGSFQHDGGQVLRGTFIRSLRVVGSRHNGRHLGEARAWLVGNHHWNRFWRHRGDALEDESVRVTEWFSYPIGKQATPRQCSYCALPARRVEYRASLNGELDKSSRRFNCGNEHPDGVVEPTSSGVRM